MAHETGDTVRIEIIRILGTGTCPSGYEVGQSWTMSGGECPPGMCAWAFNAILPFVSALRFGGTFPWSGERTARVACPDGDNPVVFRLTVE